MTEPTSTRESRDDRIERILVELIDAMDAGDVDLVEDCLRRHPEEEDELRAHLAALTSMQLLEDRSTFRPPFEEVDEFRLLQPLGRGGMGEVWLAEQKSLRRAVAVKFIRAGVGASERTRERFRREARAMAALDHPHVARVWSSGTHESGLDWIAMEYIPGRGLDEILADARQARSNHDVERFVTWSIEVAGALQCAHEAGVIHRDVKPSNIRIRPDGRAVVIDFGLSRHLDEGSLSASGDFIGSPHYAAPEQLSSDCGDVGPGTDVYSLGLTLYEALTGSRPFEGESTDEVFRRILQTEAPSPRSVSSHISRDIETVLLMALRKEPHRRYPSAAAFGRDLTACLEGAPIAARRESSIRRAARWSRRHPLQTSIAAFFLLATATVAGVLWKFPEIRRLRDEEKRWSVQDALDEGYTQLAAGLLEEAGEHFEQALTLNPEDRDALFGYALVLLESRRNDDLHAWLDDREVHAPDVRSTNLIRRMAMNIEGRSGGPKIPPPFDAAESFFMGHIALAAGYHEQALGLLRTANLTVNESRPPYVFDLIQAEMVGGDLDGARRDLDAARLRWPEHPVADFIEATLLSRQDPARAIDLLESFLERVPGSPSALGNLGRARFRSGDVDGAIEDLERVLELRPDDANNLADLAEILHRAGRESEALAHFGTALANNGGDEDMWLSLGRFHLTSRDDPSAAVAPLRHALELAPKDGEAAAALRMAARLAGSWTDLLASARAALVLDATDTGAAADVLRACCELGRPQDAAAWLGEDHARLAERAKKWHAMATEAADTRPTGVADHLAVVRILLGRGAVEAAGVRLKLMPDDLPERFELACLIERLRRHVATASWTEALDLAEESIEIAEDTGWGDEPRLALRPDLAPLMTAEGRLVLPTPLRERAKELAEAAAALR